MNIGRFVLVFLSMFFFFYPFFQAHAESIRPTLLELTVGESMLQFEDGKSQSVYINDFEVALGLGWLPIQYMTVHAKLGVSWGYALDRHLFYAYHNSTIQTQNMFSVDIAAELEAHLPSRLPAIYVELLAKSYFVSHRAGIFRVLAGIGLTFSPFFEPYAILRTVQFGMGVRFPLVDDFNKVFDLNCAPIEFNLHVRWGF